ncbi:hypothetical protein Lal_00036686 [Lupinus albus]|nr:hypothetical protein Lal_00036686 [Lupinus albus]
MKYKPFNRTSIGVLKRGILASSAVTDSKLKVLVQVSFMFEQATIHFGATELLGYPSSRKNYKPLPQRVSCMHPETYKEISDFVGCGWPPSIVTKEESLRVQADLKVNIEAEYNLNSSIFCL